MTAPRRHCNESSDWRAASHMGFTGAGIRISGAREPAQLRTFAATPREEGEIALQAGWLGERFALNLEGTFVVDPDDGKQGRLDGSYLGANFGNFMISVGNM